jgi:alpha-mannosidase
VIEEGYRFNEPLLILPTSAQTGQSSFFSVTNPAVVLDTVKKAEDTEEIVVRLYEARGAHGTARLLTTLPVQTAQRCNLLEDPEPGTQVAWPASGLEFTVRPFEIVTFKLKI